MKHFNITNGSNALSAFWSKIIILCPIVIIFCSKNGLSQNTDELFFDDMDSYTAGAQLACQNQTDWTTWHLAPCDPVEDPFISSTHAYSGANSCLIVQSNDLVKLLGLKTSGKWYMNFAFYIPAGKSGYFNTLTIFSPPTGFQWGMECDFNAGGAGVLDYTNNVVPFTWLEDHWNQVMVVVDLDRPGTSDQAEFWFGPGPMTQIATWDWTQGGSFANSLDANSFYGRATNEMYFDNYYFSDVPPPVIPLHDDVGTESIDLASLVAPGNISPKATIKNYGVDTNTFDVQMTITGGYTSTKTVTALAPGVTEQVEFDNWTATTGEYEVDVCTQLSGDEDPANDCVVKDVIVWDSSGSWTSGTSYPTTTYLGSGVGYVEVTEDANIGYLFSIAGNTSSALGTECYKYNVVTDTWTQIASLPSGRRVLASATVGDFVYAIAGSNLSSVYQSTVYKYDIALDTWTTVAPLPIAVGWGKAVGYENNYIYFAGGLDASSNPLAKVYVYNVTLNTWTQATSMPGPKFGGAFTVTDNQLVYVAGGDDAGISNTVYVGTIIAPIGISWVTANNPYPGVANSLISGSTTNLAELMVSDTEFIKGMLTEAVAFPPGSMYRFDGAPWGTEGIIVAGGSPTADWTPADPNPCYVYNPTTDTWNAHEIVPIPVLGHSLGTVNDGGTWKLIVASGLTIGSVDTNATQIFTKNLGETSFALSVTVANGWNMVSVPGVNPDGQGVDFWWSGKDPAANVFKYVDGSGYLPVTTAAPTEGYWMKHLGANVYQTGDEWPAGGIQIVTHNDISAAAGWNLIGGYEDSVATSSLVTTPPGLITGPVYGYVDGFGYLIADNLVPGYGYWVKMSSAGLIGGLSAPPLGKVSNPVTEYIQEDWGKIIITDNAGISYTLYAINGEVDLTQYELPPSPPAGMFDIRFGSDRIAEDISSTQSIDMSGIQYPITVSVEGMDIRVQDESGNEIDENVKSGDQITISNTQINKLMVSGELIPDVYALEQNYPNPFNPSTVIEFSMKNEVQVNLSVFNILGEVVKELKNEVMKPGYYKIEFNASTLASGVYLYRIKAGAFVETKKMVLMK